MNGLVGTLGNVSVSVEGDANIIIATGVAGTSALGSISLILNTNISVAGYSVTGNVGAVTFNAKANVLPNGVSATGEVGKFLIWSRIDENQTPNYTTITDTQSSSFSKIDETQIPSWEEVA